MKDMNVDKCISCGLCTKKCLFLEKYDMNLSDFAKKPELAYSCFLCGKCKEVCPKDIDGAGIAMRLRKESIDNASGRLKDSSYNGLMWEKNPYKFTNYRRGNKKSVLFPGCSFTSFYPKTTRSLETIMAKHGIGVVYDCCRKPVYELGLWKDATDALKTMEERLRAQGVEELIMVCPNCYHFMKDKIGIPMVTIYEKLRGLGEGNAVKREVFPVYYPCPDRAGKRLFHDIKDYLDGEVTEPYKDVQCCGLGGCAAGKEPELAEKMTKKVSEQGQGELYTYCASCISNFRRKGYAGAYHVLPLILGIDEKVPLGMQPFINRAKKRIL